MYDFETISNSEFSKRLPGNKTKHTLKYCTIFPNLFDQTDEIKEILSHFVLYFIVLIHLSDNIVAMINDEEERGNRSSVNKI